MASSFTCILCSAPGSVSLPDDGAGLVTCSACRIEQPRRTYDILALEQRFARAAERIEAEKAAHRGAPGAAMDEELDEGACPECGDAAFTRAHGCTRCGHGAPRLSARDVVLSAPAVAFATCLAGAAGVLLYGSSEKAPYMHLLFIGMSTLFSGLGARALKSPTTMSVASIDHTDAWGHTTYGPSRQATAEEGRTTGSVFVAVGIVFLFIGVFLRALTG